MKNALDELSQTSQELGLYDDNNLRVLFLDFDGVLNSGRWFAKTNTSRSVPEYPRNHFDPDAIALLNEVVERTGCVVVVSSSWRYGRTLDELNAILSSVGTKARVISVTPTRGGPRGEEIALWLEANQGRVVSYAVVDDDSDMDAVRPRFVKTTFADGLMREQVERLVELLQVPL